MTRYVTSPAYAVDIGGHVFPTGKYGAIVDRLVREDGVAAGDIVGPGPADEADVLLVHDRDYYQKCRRGTLSLRERMQLELPWSPALFDAAVRCVQGSILAAEHALEDGVGIHVGGGFHHAFPDHGEGFCVFNDHAVALRKLMRAGRARRGMVIDTDLHQGNGTAVIFAGEPAVATFSIHQEDIYPAVKPPSTLDVGVRSGTGDERYLALLARHLLPLVREHRPELVAWVAGADPYRDDQLGTLELTMEGLARRDEIVVGACAEAGAALFLVLGGGYARRLADTVAIHLQSIRIARALSR